MWVESWLEAYTDSLHPSILMFEADGTAVGACLLIAKTEKKGPIPLRRLYVNTAGEAVTETVYVAFNTLVCLPAWSFEVARALADHVRALNWDELALDGWYEDACLDDLSNAFPDLEKRTHRVHSPYVDLAELRSNGTTYESCLSANTRAQIKRSIKLYGQSGPMQIDVAPDLPTALGMLDELIDLHRNSWSRRGQIGAFAAPSRLNFHRALIGRAFPRHEIQLLRVRAGDLVIGMLYNFVYKGKVYAYQSGFSACGNNRLKPGLVSHTCAIQYYLKHHDCTEYDFLAGEERYKQSLSTHSRYLAWITFRKRTAKLAFIDLLYFMRRIWRDNRINSAAPHQDGSRA